MPYIVGRDAQGSIPPTPISWLGGKDDQAAIGVRVHDAINARLDKGDSLAQRDIDEIRNNLQKIAEKQRPQDGWMRQLYDPIPSRKGGGNEETPQKDTRNTHAQNPVLLYKTASAVSGSGTTSLPSSQDTLQDDIDSFVLTKDGQKPANWGTHDSNIPVAAFMKGLQQMLEDKWDYVEGEEVEDENGNVVKKQKSAEYERADCASPSWQSAKQWMTQAQYTSYAGQNLPSGANSIWKYIQKYAKDHDTTDTYGQIPDPETHPEFYEHMPRGMVLFTEGSHGMKHTSYAYGPGKIWNIEGYDTQPEIIDPSRSQATYWGFLPHVDYDEEEVAAFLEYLHSLPSRER